MTDGFHEYCRSVTRRHFLGDCMSGIGAAALASITGGAVAASEDSVETGIAATESNPMSPRAPHFPARIKNVIFLHMAGAPSQIDLFDPKPRLRELDGQECPADIIAGEKFAFIRGTPKILGSPYKFAPNGESGIEFSELLPHTASVADDLTLIRSMHTTQFNHAPAQLFLYTGFQLPGRPSMGAWVTYGLGSENQDLPGFVVLISNNQPDGGNACWGTGFLPGVYQGVEFRSQGEPVLFAGNPKGVSRKARRDSLDAIRDLNNMNLARVGDPEIATRIQQYEMAFRMQASVPELSDLSAEPAHIHEMYGTSPGESTFANNCLLARRLVERGVRFVQLFHWGWDSHGTGSGDDIMTSLPSRCRQTDQASAALIRDLKQRGLLDETLVVWGGEFGRTPMNEERNGSKFLGRDHHPRCFSIWMAGGGLKHGTVWGATDELGYNIAENPVGVHDLQATILHLLGLDHTRLTYRFQGRDYRLTDVEGEIVRGILA